MTCATHFGQGILCKRPIKGEEKKRQTSALTIRMSTKRKAPALGCDHPMEPQSKLCIVRDETIKASSDERLVKGTKRKMHVEQGRGDQANHSKRCKGGKTSAKTQRKRKSQTWKRMFTMVMMMITTMKMTIGLKTGMF